MEVHASGSAGAEPKQGVKEGRRRRRGRGATGDGFAGACIIEDVGKAALQLGQLEQVPLKASLRQAKKDLDSAKKALAISQA